VQQHKPNINQYITSLVLILTKNIKKSKSKLGRATSPPLMQRMDSFAAHATSRAMSTADKSNQ